MGDQPRNVFIGKTEEPTDADLERALGPLKTLWDRIIGDLAAVYGVSEREWKSYSPKHGWALRLKRRRRTIVWMSPCDGCISITFILSDGAVKAARETRLPARVLRALDEAPKYPEGTGLRLQVKRFTEVAAVMKLTAIKSEN
jgi:hypothetical protein